MILLRSFFYDFRNVFTTDEKLITLLAASVFLPYPITILTFVGVGMYALLKSEFRVMLKSVRKANILMLFALYLLVVSLFSKNYLGAIVSVGIIFLFVSIIYYRKYISKELFVKIIDMMIIISIISVFVSIGEQLYYTMSVKGMDGFFDIQNKPQHRVHLFYLNANYYALMILYVVSFCVYRFMDSKEMRRKLLYVIAGVLNLFALFLTGGRIAWLALAIGILVMLFVKRWYKTLSACMLGVLGAVGLLALKPGLIPRLAEKGLALGRRSKIYKTAMLMIQDHAILGRGPLTYYTTYEGYTKEYISLYGNKGWGELGISAPHAHSLFLEPIVSFGIVGTLILGYYLLSQLKRLWILTRHSIDTSLSALIFGFIAITITFCMIDFPIYWVQTAGLFLLVLGSSDMYRKELV